MSEQEQEIYEIVEDLRFICTFLVGTQQNIIPPETSWFVDMLKRRIKRGSGRYCDRRSS